MDPLHDSNPPQNLMGSSLAHATPFRHVPRKSSLCTHTRTHTHTTTHTPTHTPTHTHTRAGPLPPKRPKANLRMGLICWCTLRGNTYIIHTLTVSHAFSHTQTHSHTHTHTHTHIYLTYLNLKSIEKTNFAPLTT